MAQWITFSDGYSCCIEIADNAVKDYTTFPSISDYYSARTAEYRRLANEIADERKTSIKTMQSLPYPAEPRRGSVSSCPSFCYTPTKCAGRNSCPKSHSCDD